MAIIQHGTVLPGDVIDLDEYGIKKKKLVVGPGLQKHQEEDDERETAIKACKAGSLKHKLGGGSTIWVDNPQKRVSIP